MLGGHLGPEGAAHPTIASPEKQLGTYYGNPFLKTATLNEIWEYMQIILLQILHTGNSINLLKTAPYSKHFISLIVIILKQFFSVFLTPEVKVPDGGVWQIGVAVLAQGCDLNVSEGLGGR